jgi:hypothetical protein
MLCTSDKIDLKLQLILTEKEGHFILLTQKCSCAKEEQGQESGTGTEGRAIRGLPHLGIHPVCRHCCSQENLMCLFLGRSGQQLTSADVDAWSQPWDWAQGPHRGAGRRTEGGEGDCNPIGRTTLDGQTTQCSQRLDHQPRSVPGGIHVSRHIYNRRWLCLTAMGGEVLGPVEVWCPRVGGCWSSGAGEGWWVEEHSLTVKWERGRMWDGGFVEA